METRIRTMLESGELSFKGARKRYLLPAHCKGKLAMIGIEHADETGEPRAACITQACAIYWRLYDEENPNAAEWKPASKDDAGQGSRKR